MITVSASLQNLLQLPAIEPRFFVDIETGSGTWYVSDERLTWGGNSYAARLAAKPSVQTDLGPPGLVGPHDVSIDINNADGAYSQFRPEFFRGRMLTIKQGFREVDSEAIWAIKFKMTSTEVMNPETFRIVGSDLLTDLRRKLIPDDALLITTSLFPKIPSDSPATNRVVPVGFGNALTPMHLVEDQTSGRPGAAARFVARARDPNNLAAFTFVFQSFNQELVSVESFTSTVETMANGVLLGMVQQASNPRVGGVGELLPHFVLGQSDLPGVTGATVHPDQALLQILTHSYLAGGDGASLVDSANWVAVRALTESPFITPVWDGWNHWDFFFRGALTEQAPLQAVLDDWAYSSYCHLLIRDKIRIVPQVWRQVVYSFHPGNILAGTMTRRDVPLEELETTHILHFQQTVDEVGLTFRATDTEPRATVRTTAGSGATVEHVSHFIGKRSMAQQLTDVWARREAAAVRTYELESTVRASLLEEGDLVSLYHPLYCNVTSFGLAGTNSESIPGQLCEVVGMTRGETVRVRLREADLGAFLPVTSKTGALTTVARAAVIGYGGPNVSVNPTAITITTSHRLSAGSSPGSSAPTLVYARLLPNAIATTINSLVTANNSQFTLALTSTASYDTHPSLQGFFARL